MWGGALFTAVKTGMTTADCREVCRTQATGSTTASRIKTAKPAATTRHGKAVGTTGKYRAEDMLADILPPETTRLCERVQSGKHRRGYLGGHSSTKNAHPFGRV
jgi:hypothetical protein